jgi:predicted MPP superfamily phosphohydrolase
MAALARPGLSQRLFALAGRDTHVVVARRHAFIPDLPEALDGLRIGHLSDPHVGLVTPDVRIRNGIGLLRTAGVELCVMTGDFASRRPGPVARIGKLLAGLEVPTYFVLGNHDHAVDAARVAEELEGVGYIHLANRSVVSRCRGHEVCIVGLDDPVTGKADVARAFADAASTRPRLLLAHFGEALDAVARAQHRVDVCFSGHTHGGQLVLPTVTDVVLRRAGIHHARGMSRFRTDGPWLHVTNGIGSAVNPIRFRAAPEVAVVTLHRDRRHTIFRGA